MTFNFIFNIWIAYMFTKISDVMFIYPEYPKMMCVTESKTDCFEMWTENADHA